MFTVKIVDEPARLDSTLYHKYCDHIKIIPIVCFTRNYKLLCYFITKITRNVTSFFINETCTEYSKKKEETETET